MKIGSGFLPIAVPTARVAAGLFIPQAIVL
jgi:hypothetical protein